jgi:hypothetical protein
MNLYILVERLSADPVATLKSSLIAGHLLGLVLGVGAATLLDLFIIRFLVMKKVSSEYCSFVEFASKIVTVGLLVLWLTGFGFLIFYALFEPIKLSNQKVWAKIVIVCILTLNGIFIHKTVLPLIRNRLGRNLFDGLRPGQRTLLLATGAVSATSWYVPLLLGALPQLNFLPAWPILLAYVLLLSVAIVATHGLARIVLPRVPMVMLSRAEYEALLTRATSLQNLVVFPVDESRMAHSSFEPARAQA